MSLKVDLILASATPDTTNPVADQAEVNEVPCITTNCPWQPYFFGRKGDPEKPFKFTYHFSFGVENFAAAYISQWGQLKTNKKTKRTTRTINGKKVPVKLMSDGKEA